MDNTGEKANHKVKMHKIAYASGVVGAVMLNIVSWRSVEFSDWYIKLTIPVSFRQFSHDKSQQCIDTIARLGRHIQLIIALYCRKCPAV